MKRKDNGKDNGVRRIEVKVNNLPEDHRPLVVARIDGSDLSLWYWGSWDIEDKEKAIQAASEINGVLLEMGDD